LSLEADSVRFLNGPLAPRIVVVVAIASSIVVLAMLLTTDQTKLFQGMIPVSDDTIARHYIEQLRTRHFSEIERHLDPRIGGDTQAGLEQAASLIAGQPLRSLDAVGFQENLTGGEHEIALAYEATMPHSWALVQIVPRGTGASTMIEGLRVNPMSTSLETVNAFTLHSKDLAQYAWLVAAVAVGLFTTWGLVVCAWEPYVKLRWLWLLLICFGVAQFSMNWTSGSSFIQPIAISVPTIAFRRMGPIAPWIVSFWVPLGAIIFMLLRGKLTTRTVPTPEPAQLSDAFQGNRDR
jgi:hypothetical protein